MLNKYLVIIFLFASPIINAQQWLWGEIPRSYLDGKGISTSPYNCAAADGLGNAYSICNAYHTLFYGSYAVTGGSSYGSPYIVKYDKYGNFLWVQSGKLLATFSSATVGSVACYGNSAEYVVGTFTSNISFGNDTLFSPYYFSMFLVKYTSAGTETWANEAITTSGHGYVFGNSVAVNNSGDVFITGYYADSMIIGHDTSLALPRAIFNHLSVYLIKYDSNGNMLWARQSVAAANGTIESGNAVVADKYGNSYLTGCFTDSIGFGPYFLQNHGDTSKQMFLVKYNAAGNVVWAKQTTGKSSKDNINPESISIDAFGKLYIAGTIADTINFGYDSLIGNSTNNTSFLAKYDSAGNVVWLKLGKWADPNQLFNYSLAVTDTLTHGAAGILQVTGQGTYTFSDSTFLPASDTITNPTEGVVVQFDTAGKVICGNFYREGYNTVAGDGVAVDPAGLHVYVSGVATATNYNNIYGLDTLAISNLLVLPYVLSWSPCCHVAISMSPLDTTICRGSTVSITAGGASSYYWLQSSTVYGDTTSTIHDTPFARNVVYGVLATKAGCSNIATADVTVDIPPSLYINPSNPTICYGDSVVLSTSGWATYLWSTGSTKSTLRVLPLNNPTVYTLTVTSGVCIKDTTSTITVNPTPTLTVTFPPEDCPGTSVMLSVSGASNYQWTPIYGLSCSNCPDPNADPAFTVPYTIVGSNSYGCSATVTDTLHILPGFTVTTDSTPETSPCNGSAKVIVSGGVGPFTYLWAPGGKTTDTINAQCWGTYCCTITDHNGCAQFVCTTILRRSSNGVNDLEGTSSGINIYPDPNSGYFNVSGLDNGQLLVLYNYLGQAILRTTIKSPNTNINISSQPDGMYLLRVENKDGSLAATKKILKD